MDKSKPVPRLLVWSLGTFHAILFELGLAMLLYLDGSLGRRLGEYKVLVGIGVFAVLWACTLWCTRRAVRGVLAILPSYTADVPIPVRRILRQGVLWGGLNGVVFLFVVLVLLDLIQLFFLYLNYNLGSISFLIFMLVAGTTMGSVGAFALGAVLGLVIALVDLGLLRGLQRLLAPA